MQNEEQNPLSFITTAVRWIVDAIAKSAVELFDGIRHAATHGAPSLFSMTSTVLPFVVPLPIAALTAHSLEAFFAWPSWASVVMAASVEGIGLMAWTRLTDAVLETVNGKSNTNSLTLYGAVCVIYEAILIIVNAYLEYQAGEQGSRVLVLALLCILPALSAALFARERLDAQAMLDREAKAKADAAEKIRQERRADRKEAQALRAQYAADTKQEKLDQPPFRGKPKR